MEKNQTDSGSNNTEVLEKARLLSKEGLAEIMSSDTSKILEEVKVKYIGKKGLITEILKSLGNVSNEDRKIIGQEINIVKAAFESSYQSRLSTLLKIEEDNTLSKERIDVTIPTDINIDCFEASLHPLTQVRNELENIFLSMGFDVVDAPELETEFFNFEALNIPGTHPARDMQDTIWTKEPGYLMRTHTSTTQVRTLLERGAPVRIVAPGRCFRYERLDATHEHTFYQMDGMMVDREVSVGHLIYFMKTLLRKIYGFEPKIRLRPGYFPFVEPGFELDIWFNNRWLELLPCGLMHPEVLKHGGIDPDKYQGFAFGLGLSRLVMTRYKIDDIRHMQSGDLRFLSQF